MALLIAASIFLVLTALISYWGFRRYARPGRFYEHVGVADQSTAALLPEAEPASSPQFVVRMLEQIGEMAPLSPQDTSVTRRYLIAAGYRSERAVAIHYGIKIVSCVLLFLAALLFRSTLIPDGILQTAILVAAPAAGFFLPNLVLERLVKKRQQRLRLALPDALDLMVVCVEAGLGLDQAVLTVSQRLARAHKDLSDEFSVLNLQMRAGTSRADALRNLADRTGESTIKELVAILVQTDRFGTSMADSLRSHGDYMRIKRRQDAEEKANKIGVKLVFPIFFFLMPAIVIVTTGPALIQLFREMAGIIHTVQNR